MTEYEIIKYDLLPYHRDLMELSLDAKKSAIAIALTIKYIDKFEEPLRAVFKILVEIIHLINVISVIIDIINYILPPLKTISKEQKLLT